MNFPRKLSAVVLGWLWLAIAAAAGPVRADAGAPWDNTFSIVARDPATGALGAAVSTARLAVGNRVLLVEHQVAR